ncbi:alpha/beta fold hydrolase [Nocardioidaceae bacterium]|nr:alpha/beta fold hydrolase [Nocardioidaceae bacterium]
MAEHEHRDDPLHVREIGDSGERVIFLHGLFGQGKNFTTIAKDLRPDLRSTLVDLPNHGRSAWTDSVDYVATADVIAAWWRETYAEPAHLVGHSMGGKVAMVLALRHPDLVDRLVVVDISPTQSEGTGESGEFAHLLDSLAALDLATLERRGEADERLAERVDDARVRGFLLQNLHQQGEEFSWRANLDLLREGLPVIGGFPELDATFDHPVLWIAGERSDYVQDAHDPAMRALFPRTRQLTIKGAGHWVHAERPEAFTASLRVFLTA